MFTCLEESHASQARCEHGSVRTGHRAESRSAGCGGSGGNSKFGDSGSSGSGGTSGSGSSGGLFGGDDGGSSGSSGSGPAQCPAGAQCNVSCPSGTTTSISGKVYDPALKDGLYNVTVYVPGGALEALPKGVPTGADACNCGALFKSGAVVSTTTGVDGTFKLTNAPVGTNIPLVLQVGKWRRALTVNTDAVRRRPQADKSLVAAGNPRRRRAERQHARHRRVDRQRRHARVPHEAHRHPRQRVRRGRRHQRPHPRVLGRRPERGQGRWRRRRGHTGEARHGRRARERHDAVELAGEHDAVRHPAALVRGRRDVRRESAEPRGIPQRGRSRVRVALPLRVVQRPDQQQGREHVHGPGRLGNEPRDLGARQRRQQHERGRQDRADAQRVDGARSRRASLSSSGSGSTTPSA